MRVISTSIAVGALVSLALSAHAATVVVNAADNIYGAGQASAPGGGNVPSSVAVTGSDFTFSVTGGLITLNSGGNYNDADGVGAAPGSSSNSGSGSISGITAPNAGYLVGVFVPSGGPSGAAPTALDFTDTNFSSLSPQLDQVFFIGDGLTGDGTGSTQTFIAPIGATELYLGISDACGYGGEPGCYGDNTGTFSVDVAQAAGASGVPEPASWAMLLVGVGMIGGGLRIARGKRSMAFSAG